jgi:hypothetical protein
LTIPSRPSGWRAFLSSLPRPPLGLPVAALCLLTVLVSQWWAGCYTHEAASFPDEPAHLVTGLMVRDYLLTGLGRHPMRFAEDYYFHYPKVAIGYWPPFFYLVQGVWGLPFSDARLAVMLLQALLASLLGWSVYRFLIRWFDVYLSAAAAVLVVLVPAVLNHSRQVMAEVLMALLVFLATAAYGRYLETVQGRWSLAFGLLALAAVMTKGTGAVLALVPPLAVVFTRRWSLLARPSFWLPALIVLAGAGPWYWLAPGATNEATVLMGGLGRTPQNRWVAVEYMLALAGPVLFALALTGLVERLVRIRQGRLPHGVWTAVVALLGGFLVVPSAIPVMAVDRRYFIGVIAALVVLAAAGLAFLLERIPAVWRKPAVAVVFAGVVMLYYPSYAPRLPLGYAQVARNLVARPDLKDSVFLVVSDSVGEGVLVSEVAMAERRPGHIVLRGSKVLGRSSWSGRRIELLVKTPEQAMQYLESVPIEILVTEQGRRRPLSTETLIAAVVEQYPDRWKLIDSYSAAGGVGRRNIRVYQLNGIDRKTRGRIRIDLGNRINRLLER